VRGSVFDAATIHTKGIFSVTTIDRPVSHDFDPAIRPQDDLFGHVNGAWAATADIPEDRADFGSFDRLRDDSERDVRVIIEEAAKAAAPERSEQRKIGDLYTSFMDEVAVEAAGVNPLRPFFDQVQAVGDREELVNLLGLSPPSASAAPWGCGPPSIEATRVGTCSTSSRAVLACPTSRTTGSSTTRRFVRAIGR